ARAPPTCISALSLHDALPTSPRLSGRAPRRLMLLALELIGVVAFAASGALAAVQARLDLFGVAVLAVTTGLGGGILRDVLLGVRSEEHTSELQSRENLVCRLL